MKENSRVLKILIRTAIAAVLTALVAVLLAWLWVSRMTSGVVDNGAHMGRVLRDGANQLRRSGDTELVVEYQPMTGIEQEYYVDFRASSNPTGAPLPGKSYGSYGKGYVSVGGERPGSTTYHQL